MIVVLDSGIWISAFQFGGTLQAAVDYVFSGHTSRFAIRSLLKFARRWIPETSLQQRFSATPYALLRFRQQRKNLASIKAARSSFSAIE